MSGVFVFLPQKLGCIDQTSIQSKELSSVLLSHSALHIFLSPLDGLDRACAISSWGWCEVFFCWLGSFLSDWQHISFLHSLSMWLFSDLITWLSSGCCCPKWDSSVWYWSLIWLRWLGPLSSFALAEWCLWSELRLCGWVCSCDPGGLSWLCTWSWWFCQKFLRSCSSSESRDSPMSKCIRRLSRYSSSFEKGGLKESRDTN